MKDIAGSITTYLNDGSKTVTKFNNSVFVDERGKYFTKHEVKTNLTDSARTIAGGNYLNCDIHFVD